ncbi:hypothetical protein IJJ49_02410 [Candidatus Saccharibacteria bacterium]|nr:hypothetical protein [Candidatus Saccharibacteria bacterium]
MIKIFTGDDRVRAKTEIEKILGKNYEVFDGPDLNSNDLPTLFLGTSLFSETRKILIRDLSANSAAFSELPNYLNSPHDIIIFELKLDKRSSVYKELKDKIEIHDFPLAKNPNFNLVFDIYHTAKKDGKKALEMLEKVKANEDPIMFFGLLASQALKDYQNKQGTKEKRALKELSKLDLELKSTSIQPWLLIQSFLLRLSSQS